MVWLPYSLRMVLVWTTLVPALRLLELWEWVCCVVSAWRSATLAGCGGLPHAVQCDIEEQRRVQQDHKAIMQCPVSGGGAEGG